MPPPDFLDQPEPERPGEELDRGALGRWLAAAVPGMSEAAGELEVLQFGSGYSNLTYLVRRGGREVVLRRPPAGSRVATAHDMLREHRLLAGLAPVYPLAPRPIAACDDLAVLGAPFFVMERVHGRILRGDPSADPALDPPAMRRLGCAFAGHLAALHAVDVAAAGLGEMWRPGYTARQVRGWSERWRAAATDPVPGMDEVAAWLAAGVPSQVPPALVHNDYKLDNLVLDPADPARVVALLDWEMATVGDPRLDLGTALGYWVEAGDPEPLRRLRFGPTDLPGSLTRQEIADRYAEASGRPVDDLAFAYAFGLFKIAVIAQQIFYRFRQGLTRDPRFAGLLDAVRILAARAAEVAGGGRV